jgi:NAD(P)-dependent dehydrogenase (short-subunit alcohol dehydrogenase family)
MSEDIFCDDLFENDHVVVTGGSSGVGFGIAKKFAEKGAKLTLIARNREKLESAQNELSNFTAGSVHLVSNDVRDMKSLKNSFDEVVSEAGTIDVLVCAAAGNFPAAASEMSDNAFESVIDIDLLGTFNACRAAHDHLETPGASIISISAPQADQPMPMQSHAGAAKAGVDNLMRNLALEWSDEGIRANAIQPGPVEDTEGLERLTPDEETRNALAEVLPSGRFVRKTEIGSLCLYLASPLAECITGTVLTIDCGQKLIGSGELVNSLLQ